MAMLPRLTFSEWGELLAAQWAVIVAQALVWVRPRGRLVSVAPPTDGGAMLVVRPADRVRARRLAVAVDRAARRGLLRPACLVRAVALQRMLDQQHLHGSRIRVGVRNSAGGFAAHAWVEYDRGVLGDVPAHVRSFAAIADVSVVEP
jgi:hypothetical protein